MQPESSRNRTPTRLREKRTSGWLALALSTCFAGGASEALRAQPPSSGPPFQVNTHTTGPQELARVASDTGGDFVVVWFSFGSAGSDQDGSIHAQRYSADGQPASGELQVNTYTTSFQIRPDVAMGAGGSFVVVWYSDGSFGTDNDAFSIQARRYDGDGTPLGNEFQVNTYTPGVVQRPRVGADATGNFVVVWESRGSPGTDSDQYSIQARRFAANGTPLGDQFQVNTYTTSFQAHPDVAVDDLGRFVVVWSSVGSSGSDQSYYSVQAQRYAANGAPQGAQFQVNSYTTGFQNHPSVACDSSRNFVVAWDSDGSAGTDTSFQSIQARLYATDGSPQGGQFQVNTYTTNNQNYPSVTADSDRDFTIVWASSGASQDPSGYSIQGRWYTGDGDPRGSQLQINTYTTGNQSRPSVASDAFGNTMFTWQSPGSNGGTDTSDNGIVARRYDGLFRDGFERGDTLRWSDVLP